MITKRGFRITDRLQYTKSPVGVKTSGKV